MSKPFVTVSTKKAEAMFDRLAANADHVQAALETGGKQMLASISGIPVDTGELAASPHLEVRGMTALILSDVLHARFVFYGHKDRGGGWVEAQPPSFGYTADDFARDVADELFRI